MNMYRLDIIICLLILVFNNLTTNSQTTIEWDIGEDGILIIPGTSTDAYIISGSTNTNYVVVETGYRGVITLRNLNITLDVTQLIQRLWSIEYPNKLNEMREQDEYKEKQAELAELEQELIDLPGRDDYLQLQEELIEIQEELEARKQWDDYKQLQEELIALTNNLENHPQWNDFQNALQELTELQHIRQNLGQQPEYAQKQQELQQLWQTFYADVIWSEINTLELELATLRAREEYPGKAQHIQELIDEIQKKNQAVWQLPILQDIDAVDKEIAAIEKELDDKIITKQQEISDLRNIVMGDIWGVQNEIAGLEAPYHNQIYTKILEIAQLEQDIRDDISNKQQEMQALDNEVLDEFFLKVQELNSVLSNSPISVKGQSGLSNLTPITNVDIILEGDNTLRHTGELGYPAFHVEQGAQINISAIEPSDNNSGKLSATVANEYGGAGIGALSHERIATQQGSHPFHPHGLGLGFSAQYIATVATIEATATASIIGECSSDFTLPTAGGNVVISSGTITARGGHGAGIGGGWGIYYDGIIVIYGGIIDVSAIKHAAGIGSGCPFGEGVEECYTSNSAIIALPPAQITGAGAGILDNRNTNAYVRNPEIALAGSSVIVYFGDPAKPEVTVHTEDFEPFATIYVDLSESPPVARAINATVPPERLDINKIRFGQTNNTGLYKINGLLNDDITFFTDAVSSKPETYGRPYIPETVKLPGPYNSTVILKLLPTNLSIEAVPSDALCEDYRKEDALRNAFRVKITYLDETPMENVVFEMADGVDFSKNDMKFYASDGITEITPPTIFTNGNVIFVAVPIETTIPRKEQDIYSDVFLFSGTWNNMPTGYIRQIVSQNVGILDISAITQSETGGKAFGSNIYSCDELVTVRAEPDEGYEFVNWTRGGVIVSTSANYSFNATEGLILVANFALKTYEITLSANPTEGGEVSVDEPHNISNNGVVPVTHFDMITVRANPNDGYKFINWTENGVPVSTSAVYGFEVSGERNLVANFRLYYIVNVNVNIPDYGYTAGDGDYFVDETATITAIANDCYLFDYWSEDGVRITDANPYVFTVTRHRNLVAHFKALDFDTYAPMLWDNTFMLDLKKLEEEGYDVTGCKWFKNGTEERNTRTINEFSYSAGPEPNDRLETAPTYYMFKLITNNFGNLCSYTKSIEYLPPVGENTASSLLAYPNPLTSGNQITIEGVEQGSIIYVYNQVGFRINSAVASDSVVTITLPATGGIYLIRNGNKTVKIVVTN